VAIASILLLLLVFGWECTFSIKNFPYHTKQFYKWCRIYISLFNKLTHNRYERLVKYKTVPIMSYHNNINPLKTIQDQWTYPNPGICCCFCSFLLGCLLWNLDYWDYFSIHYCWVCVFILFILLSNNWFYTAIA
jgi:hypothetical protein